MHDFINSLDLPDVQTFLLNGHPPIIVQLMAVNTVVMVLFILRGRRANNAHRRHLTYVTQWIFVLMNLVVVCEEQWLPYADHSRQVVSDRYSTMFHYN
ncbi:MAG: hypothetical protein KGO53_07205 [Alphaproteobacteria bacterium]|nr:hypothetical protein [Alphaproteobacteria bacterium]